MTKKEVAKQYIRHLEKGEVSKILSLFSEKGMVNSPLYGTKKAADFYAELANDTISSLLKIKGIFEEENTNQLALYFQYTWTLANQKKVTFDVVDILQFDKKNNIQNLKIIYDTVQARELFNQLNS